jgi:F420-0:gamma-glutamyl ligase-like protein
MLKENIGKKLLIEIEGVKYARYPIKTKLVTPDDSDIIGIIKQFAKPHIQKGDILFISEKVVAIAQNRAYKTKDVKASFLAKRLSRFVVKNPAGIGLAMPETMQMALEECGVIRIVFAAICAALTKPFGIKGVFYRIAGRKAAAIDGPVPYAIPPYNEYITKGPKEPRRVACDISKALDVPVAIVDANDLGVEVLGTSDGIDVKLLKKTLRDNPLGQSDEQTPVGILRVVNI